MKKLKLLPVLIALIIIVVGVCGCMADNKDKYEEDILAYLEAKYDETFTVKKMSRITTIGTGDTIYALCYSARFPDDAFEVALKLSLYDMQGKEEIINVLKESEVYEGELDGPGPGESGISDNYINVLVQNKFDEKIKINDAFFVKTQVTTPNKYLNIPNKDITPDAFFEEYSKDIVVYTSVFVNDEKLLNNQSFLQENAQAIVNDKLQDQFIFYYATDLESTKVAALYAEHYDNHNEYFYEEKSTKKYVIEKYTEGIKE